MTALMIYVLGTASAFAEMPVEQQPPVSLEVCLKASPSANDGFGDIGDPTKPQCIMNLSQFIGFYDGLKRYNWRMGDLSRDMSGDKDGQVGRDEYVEPFLDYASQGRDSKSSTGTEIISEIGISINGAAYALIESSIRRQLFDPFDTNKDGYISNADDTNKDNRITQEDIILGRH